jgi:Alginate lyase
MPAVCERGGRLHTGRRRLGHCPGFAAVTRCAGAAVVTLLGVAVLATSLPDRGQAGSDGGGMWISRSQLVKLPIGGPAWRTMKQIADGAITRPDISNQDDDADTRVFAVGLVYGRTGLAKYRGKAASAIAEAIGSERGGRTLALARNLVGYVLAADLIHLDDYDAALGRRFRHWLSTVRYERFSQIEAWRTLVDCNDETPNNWGTFCGASLIAADVYLRDERDLRRRVAVFRGWLGDRARYHRFAYQFDTSWQCSASFVPVDPKGCMKDGRNLDGALPEEMRRGGSFQWPPAFTSYPWEALAGTVTSAQVLSRRGYHPWRWSNRAILRATDFLFRLDHEFPQAGWWANARDASKWIPWLVNAHYGTTYPTVPTVWTARSVSFTDWTHPSGRGKAR